MKRLWILPLMVISMALPCFTDSSIALPTAASTTTSTDTVPQAAPSGPEATSPDGKVWMRLHLVPGQMYAAKVTTNSKSKILWNLKPVDAIARVQISYLLRVLQKDKEKESLLRLTFSSVLVEAKSPIGYITVIDTLHPSKAFFSTNDSPYGLPFGLVMKSLMGQELILHLSPTAEVTKIEGLNELVTRIAASIPGSAHEAAVRRVINDHLRDSGFGATLGSGSILRMILPAHLIDTGDSWESSVSNTPAGVSASGPKLITAFNVSDRSKGIMTVNVKNYVKPGMEKTAGTDEKFWVNGGGTLRIDEKTGWTLGGHFNTKSKSISSHRWKNKTYMDFTSYSESEITYECTPLIATPATDAMLPATSPQ